MVRYLLPLLAAGATAAGTPAQAPIPLPALRGGVVLRAQRATATESVEGAVTDKQALESVKIAPDDAAGLLAYFRSRTLSEADLSRIQGVIRKLGSEQFDERLAAMGEAATFGPAAVGPLRKAAAIDPSNVNAADFEVAYRAGEVLKKLEKVPHTAVALAAVRALAKLPHPETCRALLAYLPLAENPAIVEEIQRTLTALAARGDRADPALVEALQDAAPLKRAFAAVALVEGGPAGSRVRIPDAYPKVLAAAKAEADADTKFTMLFALAGTSRDKEAIGLLLEMLPELPRGRLWQAEDFLLLLSAGGGPKVAFGAKKENVVKAQLAWKGWWTKARETLDLDKFVYAPRIQGTTLVVALDPRNGSGYVAELGPDMKERWRISNVSNPQDAARMPNGTYAVAEMTAGRVSIRDVSGRVIAQKEITAGGGRAQPQHLQLLPDGGLLVVCRNVILDLKVEKGEQTVVFDRTTTHDITAATRLPSGETVVLMQKNANQNDLENLTVLDKAGKEIPERKMKTGAPHYLPHMVATREDRVLLSEADKVVEYDVKEKKAVWSKVAANVRGLQRLPNGNTLMVDGGNSGVTNRVVEVNLDGEEVWSHALTDGLMFVRAYRR